MINSNPSNLSNEIEEPALNKDILEFYWGADWPGKDYPAWGDLTKTQQEELEALTTLFNKQIVAELEKVLQFTHTREAEQRYVAKRIKELGGAE